MRWLLALALALPLRAAAQPARAPRNAFARQVILTPDPLRGLAYSPDGRRLVAGGQGPDVTVFDAETGQPLLALRGHTDEVLAVAYSPNGRYIATGGIDKALILWDALTGELLRRSTDHTGYVRDVAFSPDSKHLASAGAEGLVLVFDAFGGQRLATLPAGTPAAASNAPSNAASNAATASASADLAAAPATGLPNDPAATAATNGPTGPATSVAFSPDGSELLTAGGRQLQTWNAATWQLKTTLLGHTDEVCDARYAPNGRFVVSGALDNTVRVWFPAAGRCVRILAAHASDVWATAFSPDGQLIATGGGDRRVKTWDAVLGSLVQTVSAADHTGEVENLVFSPDGRTLASVSRDGSLRRWHVPTPDERVLAYADHELAKWERRGEVETNADHQRRLARKYERLKELQAQGQALMLAGFAATADWQPLALGNYNADTEAFTLTSGCWPGLYHVKVPRNEAPAFRENFGQRRCGAPVLAFVAGVIALQSMDLTVPYDGVPHAFTLGK